MPFEPIEIQYANVKKDRLILNESNLSALLDNYNALARSNPQNVNACANALRILAHTTRLAEEGGNYEKGAHARLDQLLREPPRSIGVVHGDASRNVFVKLNAAISYNAANNNINL